MRNNAINEILKDEDYIEPETIRMFRGEDTPSLQVLKDMTYNLVVKTRAPYVDFYVFENVVHVLNDIEPDVENVKGSTPEQIWFALHKIKEMLGEDPELSHEVKAYIKFIYRDNGILFMPNIGFNEIDNPLYEKVTKHYKTSGQLTDDNPLDIQAIKFGRINEYLKFKTQDTK